MTDEILDTKKWPATRIRMKKIADLIFDERNARVHSDAQIKQLAASIREWGWTIPVLIDEKNVIIAGHGRILAAQLLGTIDQVPTMCARGWTEEQKRAYLIADNQLALNAQWDEAKLNAELAALDGLDFNLDLLGLELGAGRTPMKESDLEIDEVPTGPVNDTFWISIRGPLRYQAAVLKKMREATSGMQDVQVDLGTVGLEA